jgi:hypothetical protein
LQEYGIAPVLTVLGAVGVGAAPTGIMKKMRHTPDFAGGRRIGPELCAILYVNFYEKAHFVKPTWRPYRG